MSTPLQEGRIVGRFGSQVQLELSTGERVRATARRKLQHIVCGDFVEWELTKTKDYAVTKIVTRKNALTRQYFRGTPRTIASNVDRIVIVVAANPLPDWSLLDNALATAKLMPTDVLIIQNKVDLGYSEELQKRTDLYRQLGYPVISTCQGDKEGLAKVEEHLSTGTSVIIGQSGVGKTTLTNALIPTLGAATKPVSEQSGLGQHTTSISILYNLPNGGQLIDSPGIRDFTPVTLEASDYQHGFVEFLPLRDQCRFHNCLHLREPGCAVKTALEDGDIASDRYQTYVSLVTDAQEANRQ